MDIAVACDWVMLADADIDGKAIIVYTS